MIGVISKKNEKETVKEFFELFKTPWEFYQTNRFYDVVICTNHSQLKIKAKLILIFNSEKIRFDSENKISISSNKKKAILNYKTKDFPIYNEVATFDSTSEPLIKYKSTNEGAGIEINGKGQRILRIGYNLFQEIYFLLSFGQPPEYACYPTFDIHISILRDLILDSNIPLLEIPPVPFGYKFITCLTHDVDFFGIRNHKLDHTMLGFLYRALFVSLIGVLKRHITWTKLLKNWKSVLSLPGIYLGILQDFWVQLDRYAELEKGLHSTFFIIPFKNRHGENSTIENNTKKIIKRRQARYDVNDIKSELQHLLSLGFDIGVHGIDAWQDPEKGYEEFNQISSITGESDIGIRMHWLFFGDRSPRILEKAGFLYDSTLGYNDSIGYKSGTTQVFRLPNTERLFEVPLNIQDTSMFYEDRMNLTESDAYDLVLKLINNSLAYGGVLTFNWHHKSLAPDRLWDDFYLSVLEELKKRNTWFASAKEAVLWFKMRRSIRFDKAEVNLDGVTLRLNGNSFNQKPCLQLRIHRPNRKGTFSQRLDDSNGNYLDFPLQKQMELQFSL